MPEFFIFFRNAPNRKDRRRYFWIEIDLLPEADLAAIEESFFNLHFIPTEEWKADFVQIIKCRNALYGIMKIGLDKVKSVDNLHRDPDGPKFDERIKFTPLKLVDFRRVKDTYEKLRDTKGRPEFIVGKPAVPPKEIVQTIPSTQER